MQRTDALRYLLIMAAADGQIAREELRLLTQRAVAWGISDSQFEALLDEANEGRTELIRPASPQERTEIVRELIFMMAADGQLTDLEKDFFAGFASRIGISTSELNHLIDGAIRDGSGGEASQVVD
ncbi:MAG TPA: hypothetical protein VIY86_00835 [Pirellulaceae bacterium]